jgi:ribonuclease D
MVYILQLEQTGLPLELVRLFEEKTIIKTGVSVHFDLVKLQELGHFEPFGFVDLAEPAKKSNLSNFGLRGLAAVLLGIRIPKGAQRSNWAKEKLSENQIRYAATDAWAGREIYLEMLRKGMVSKGRGKGNETQGAGLESLSL